MTNLTENIIGAAIEVHKALGPGLLESASEFLCVLCASAVRAGRGWGYGHGQLYLAQSSEGMA